MNDIIGQYSEKITFVHKIDSRIKIILLIAASSALVLINDSGKLAVASLGVLMLVMLSRIPFTQIFKGMKTILAIYSFIILMYIIFSRENIITGLISMWKFSILLFLGLILTATTTLSRLIAGIEWLASPLRIFRLNPRNISLMLGLTVRFIPQFFFYGRRIHEAHLSRLSVMKSPREIKAFIIKMLNRMILSASTVSDSIESRCYDRRPK